MKVKYKQTFSDRFEDTLEYIAQDSLKAAKRFQKDVLKSIRSITKNPYQCRKSTFFDDTNIRDLIFRGYVIVYRINKDEIEVFGFTKHQQKPTD